MTKWALTKAGNIAPKPEHIVNRRAEKLKEVQEKGKSSARHTWHESK